MEETYVPLYSEICQKVNNAKDKPRKIQVLRKYRTEGLEMFMKSALDPRIEWLLPEGDVPYIANDAPEGTEHTRLSQEIYKLHNFVKLKRADLDLPDVLGNPNLNTMKREQMFIQLLEGLSKSEAALIITAKDKKLNKTYKGLNSNVVCEAFGWTAEFEPRS